MSQDAYATALTISLAELKRVCPDITCSFIFAKDGTIVAHGADIDQDKMTQTVQAFHSLAESAGALGDLETLLIDGENGKAHLSRVDDMYLALAASEGADTTYLQSVTRVIIPTVLKLLKSITLTTPTPSTTPTTPTPPTSLPFVPPSKQLLVETLSGFFAGDSVQIEADTLAHWAELLNQKGVNQVEIEALGGQVAQCRVKELNDPNMKGKGIIRMPEKICKTLGVAKGELVKVKPMEP